MDFLLDLFGDNIYYNVNSVIRHIQDIIPNDSSLGIDNLQMIEDIIPQLGGMTSEVTSARSR